MRHATRSSARKVSGSTVFGGNLIAQADVGYSLDGSMQTIMKQLTFWCLPSGNFSNISGFKPIEGGSSVAVKVHAVIWAYGDVGCDVSDLCR